MADIQDSSGSDGMDLGDRPIGPPSPSVIETDVKGDISLYDASQERVLVLNGTASDVWLLCDGEQTVGRIVELIAAAYGRDPATIREEVESTIHQFVEEGFLPAP